MGDDGSGTDERAQSRPSLGRDLASRSVSGIILAALAVGLLYLGTLPFGLLVALGSIAIAWEWSRLVRGAQFDAPLVVHGVAAVLAAGLGALGLAALGLAVVAAGAILVGLLAFGNRAALSALGVLYSGLPAVALLWLRDDLPYGFEAALFLLVTVAVTDIAAFLAGRTIGGPKLAPSVSPNKTWSGLAGGILAAAGAGALSAHMIGTEPLYLSCVGALFALVAQMGDLFESGLKRRFGAKDTSTLIPGHGGVMDRVDGLVFAAVAAGIMALLLNPYSPARAVLFGG